jgi:hypothetical protein
VIPPPAASRLPGDAPYNVASFELERASACTANVVDCRNEVLAVGLQVEVVFDPGRTRSCFEFSPARGLTADGLRDEGIGRKFDPGPPARYKASE